MDEYIITKWECSVCNKSAIFMRKKFGNKTPPIFLGEGVWILDCTHREGLRQKGHKTECPDGNIIVWDDKDG